MRHFTQDLQIVAGPCSIESLEQFWTIATELKSIGVKVLRGGLYKMRTQPQSFQGHGPIAYSWALEVKKHFNLDFVSEVTDPRQVSDMVEIVDCFQVGTRNMYNYELLKELGQTQTPVLLKRSFCATIEEWFSASEYIAAEGNTNILLCERGIRTFENKTRNTLDINAIAYARKYSDFPIISDPSHGTGRADLVEPLALASVAAGAHGLLIEVHNNPKEALSDKNQALNLKQFQSLFTKAHTLYKTLKE